MPRGDGVSYGVRRPGIRPGIERRDGTVVYPSWTRRGPVGRNGSEVRRGSTSVYRIALHACVESTAPSPDGGGSPRTGGVRTALRGHAVDHFPLTTHGNPATHALRAVLGLELGGSGTGAPWGLGRRTPGVVRVVQVCLRTGCSGWTSVCGCFTWNMSASVSVPASASSVLRLCRFCACVGSASAAGPLLGAELSHALPVPCQGVRASGRQSRQSRQTDEFSRPDRLSLGSDDAGRVRTIAGRRDNRATRVGIGSARGGGRVGRHGPVLVGAGVGRQWRSGVGAPAAHAG
ncbi:hypothetical protein SAMN06272775_3597 [Streptomyces sp. 2323.1]|nr:hypothetical protein SAMN06272775_3597 [Streptomyces sp. 2323.1]